MICYIVDLKKPGLDERRDSVAQLYAKERRGRRRKHNLILMKMRLILIHFASSITRQDSTWQQEKVTKRSSE